MNRRLLVVAALVATVALSGCAWQTQDDPAPTTTTNETDILVPSFRLDDHASALANQSFALTVEVTVTTAETDRNETIRVRSDPTTERFWRENETAARTLSLYLDNETLYSQIDANETSYRTQNLSALDRPFSAVHRNRMEVRWLTEIYSAANFEQTGNRTVDGREVTEFTLANTSLGDSAQVELTEADGTIYIDSRDVIRRASLELRGNRGEETVTFSVDYHVTQVGNVSVTDPAWLPDARAAVENSQSNTTDSSATNKTDSG